MIRSIGGLSTITEESLPAVIVELLLIALSVNWCASVLHGTRGTRPLRGVLTLLVVITLAINILAAQFDWPRLALLYRYFLFGLAFIALVAFQPELRRAVIRAGDVRFLQRGTRRAKVIPALVQTARYLSKNRYGGLIAIQRAVDLSGWAEKGTIINGEVSANLLNTIFFPNSPLHDLGVIIAGNKVVAANCQFPVAESDEVATTVGSRHLAAVGMSYETDALILVVSEETGTISLADNGRLARFLSIDDLSDELGERLSGQQTAATADGKERIPPLSYAWRIARRALVVIALTLIIWIVANQASQVEVDGVDVIVELRINEPNLIVDIGGKPPGLFKVSFRGTTRAIERLRDFSSENPLLVIYVLRDRYPIRVPQQRGARELLDSLPDIRSRGLSVQEVHPPDLEFLVDERVLLEVPVKEKIERVRVADVRINPDTVTVGLRGGHLAEIPPEQRLIELPLGELLRDVPPNREIRESVPVPERMAGFPLIHREPKEVDVALRVVTQRIRRQLGPVTVKLLVSPDLLQRYDVQPLDQQEWLVEIEVEGDQAEVERLQPQEVLAYVTLTAELLTADQAVRRSVEFRAPPGITVRSERSVQLNVTRENQPP